MFVPPHLYTPIQRAYFFDLGSTYFDAGVAGAADSLQTLLHMYRTLAGVEFDDVFAWEANPVRHREYWQRVDLNMTDKLHFFNTPTVADLAHPMSALRMILARVHPNDFVVLKLDIDDNPAEVEIVFPLPHTSIPPQVEIILTILQTPALIARIDELFWEHHVSGSPSQWMGWGDMSKQRGVYSSLESSYQLFTRLRQAGIRAHSWI